MARKTPTLNQRIPVNLVRCRHAQKLSQEALAQKVGISTSYVSMLEQGKRSPPLAMVERIADALGVGPFELLAIPVK